MAESTDEQFEREQLAVTTPLPLPGEFIVVQMSPVAMVKHLDRPKLSKTLENFVLERYLAVIYRVGVAPHALR